MISVEQNFFDRFPRLAEGRVRSFSQPVVDLLRRIMCEELINRILTNFGAFSSFDFIERVLEDLQVSYRIAKTDRDNIPSEGRLEVAANHPLCALDALALIQLLGTVRRTRSGIRTGHRQSAVDQTEFRNVTLEMRDREPAAGKPASSGCADLGLHARTLYPAARKGGIKMRAGELLGKGILRA